MTKKIGIIVVLVLLILSVNSVAFADVGEENGSKIICEKQIYESITFAEDFSLLDVLSVIVANAKLFDECENFIKITEIVQLCNFNKLPNAYYVTINNCYYAIINANINNPTIIEYGYGFPSFEIGSGVNYKSGIGTIVYLGDSSYIVESSNEFLLISPEKCVKKTYAEISEFRSVYPDYIVHSNNDKARALHLEVKKKICKQLNDKNNSKSTAEDLIIDSSGLEGNIVNQKRISSCYDFIPNCMSVNYLPVDYEADYIYGTTSMFNGLYGSDNHCGAVSAFNLLAYYGARNGSPLSTEMSVLLFYGLVHQYVGNGPVAPSSYVNSISDFLDDYYSGSNYTINYNVLFGLTWAKYVNYIDNDWMPFLCIWPSLLEAHYINGIGYVITDTTNYCQVINNWDQPYKEGPGFFGLMYYKQPRYYQFGVSLYAMGYFYM